MGDTLIMYNNVTHLQDGSHRVHVLLGDVLGQAARAEGLLHQLHPRSLA